MEPMDLDSTIYVMDTPDRVFSSKSKVLECVEKKNLVSAGGYSRNIDSHPQPLNSIGNHDDVTKQGGCNKQLKFKISRTLRTDSSKDCDKSVADLSSSPSPSPSQLTLKFRRLSVENPIQEKLEDHSVKVQGMDCAKALGSTHQIKPSSVANNGADQYRNGSSSHQMWAKDFSPHNDLLNDSTREGNRESSFKSAGCSSKYRNGTSRAFGYSAKGKEKTVEKSGVLLEAGVPHVDNGWNMNIASGSRAAINVAHKAQESTSKSLHQSESPKRGGTRFVRNGLISPHNIAKGKMLAHQYSSLRDSEQNNGDSSVVDPWAPEDISDSSASGKACDVPREKSVKSNLRMSKEADTGAQHLYDRNTVILTDDYNINRVAKEEVGNWRRTHSYPQASGLSLSNSRMNNNAGSGGVQNGEKTVYGTISQNARSTEGGEHHQNEVSNPSLNGHADAVPQRTSYMAPRSGRLTKRRRQANFSTRRQRTNEILPTRLNGEPSSSHINDSEVFPSDGCSNSNNVDARDWQLEADERLALELQEQLYQEDNLFSGSEMDANIASSLLQNEQAEQASSSGTHLVLNPVSNTRRTTMATHMQRQTRLGSSQPASCRRGARSCITGLPRRAQPRAGVRISSPLNFQGPFPFDMSVDTRLDILEALEAASGDINDLGIHDALFEAGHDFDENDYEILLALDENNNERGASTQQINSLPLSTVQTDNFEGNCAICLETPGLGETIRHLPCFHKFHSECIDQWLGRKTWCPVCKSSVNHS